MKIKRGDIVIARFETFQGSEQGGIRSVLIIQNDISNEFSPIMIIVPITSKVHERDYPTNVFINKEESKLDKDSTILLNRIRTIEKSRIIKRISNLSHFNMNKIKIVIKISLDLN